MRRTCLVEQGGYGVLEGMRGGMQASWLAQKRGWGFR